MMIKTIVFIATSYPAMQKDELIIMKIKTKLQEYYKKQEIDFIIIDPVKELEYDIKKILLSKEVNLVYCEDNINELKFFDLPLNELLKSTDVRYKIMLELSLKIFKILIKENKIGFDYQLAIAYNNLAEYYMSENEYISAESMYVCSFELFADIFKNDGQEYNYSLAMHSYNLGYLFFHDKKYDKAIMNYRKSIDILYLLMEKDTEQYCDDFIMMFNSLYGVYFNLSYFKNLERLVEEMFDAKNRFFPEKFKKNKQELIDDYEELARTCLVEGFQDLYDRFRLKSYKLGRE